MKLVLYSVKLKGMTGLNNGRLIHEDIVHKGNNVFIITVCIRIRNNVCML